MEISKDDWRMILLCNPFSKKLAYDITALAVPLNTLVILSLCIQSCFLNSAYFINWNRVSTPNPHA